MTDFKLRPASEAEMSLIRQWVRDSGINPLGLEWERFTVAEAAVGEVVGCVQLKPHRDGSVELASLVVAEGWRGRGVARQLVEDATARHSSAAGSGPLYLMCRSGLGVFYEKFGFHTLDEDEMPRFFRRMSRLAAIYNHFRNTEEYLLIMCREV